MTRCVGIPIHGDGFYAQALQCNNDLFPKFTATEQHDFSSGGTEWSTDNELFIHSLPVLQQFHCGRVMAAIIHSPAMMGIPENAAISFRSSQTGPFDS